MDEREAIARLQRGDISGLEALVRTYYVRAVRAAYLVAHDRDLAEDIVQSAFLRAYERIDQFDARRPFGPWFLRSVVNDAVKAASRQTRRVSLEQMTGDEASALIERLADPHAGPDTDAERAETREAVRAALLALSPVQRALIVQRYYLGLSEAEMAISMECPPGTIKSRLHAARERLRGLLASLHPLTTRSEADR